MLRPYDRVLGCLATCVAVGCSVVKIGGFDDRGADLIKPLRVGVALRRNPAALVRRTLLDMC